MTPAKRAPKRSAKAVAKAAQERSRPTVDLAAQLPAIEEVADFFEGEADSAIARQIRADAISHARTGTITWEYATALSEGAPPNLETVVNDAPSLSLALLTVFYWRVYARALAYRYVHESAVLTIAGVDWTLPQWHVLTPAGDAGRLLRADGTPAPTPLEWVAERNASGEQHGLAWLLSGLQWASASLREAALERALSEEQRTSAALRHKLKDAKDGLGTAWAFPQQLIRSAWDPAHVPSNLQRVRKGEMGAGSQMALNLASADSTAEVVASASQFGRMNTWQARALVGVLRLFTSSGTTGSQFRHHTQRVPLSLFLSAAGVGARQKDRQRLFNETLALARHTVRIGLKTQAPRPAQWKEGDPEPPWRFGVNDTAPFSIGCFWSESADKRRGLTRAEVDDISDRYLAHESGEWDGPLPDEIELVLPDIMRFIFHAPVLSSDILGALDHGAKQVRGRSESFSGLDWRLFNEVLLTRQVKDGLSYVEREAVLVDYFGAARVASDAKKYGRDIHRTERGCFAEYGKAVEVLREAAIVEVDKLEHHAAKPGRKGGDRLRDVFRLLETAYAPVTTDQPNPQIPLLSPAKATTR